MTYNGCMIKTVPKPLTSITTRVAQTLQLNMYEFACRICLKNPGVIPIFGDEKRPDISIEISSFGNVYIREGDCLPKFICDECFKHLEVAVSFRKAAKRSDTILKRWKKKKGQPPINVQNLPIKQEKESRKAHCFYLPQQSNIDYITVEVTGSSNSNVSYATSNYDEIPVEMEVAGSSKADIPYAINDQTQSATVGQFGNDTSIRKEIEVVIVSKHDEAVKEERATVVATEIKEEGFHCKYCNVGFRKFNEYEEHRSTVEHKRNYVKSFLPKKKKNALPNKEKETVNPKDCKCEICNRYFTKLHYPRHMNAEHKIKVEKARTKEKKACTICNKMLHPTALHTHMKTIHGTGKVLKPKVKLVCPICKKLFSQHFFPLHMQRHEQGDTKSYVCDQCGKKFFFKSSFFTHRLIHTNSLPHKCEYCPYRGRTKELLKIHVRTHTGDYRYKCTECDVRCLTKSNLNSHMRRHRGPVDFICDSCNRGFYSKIQLERHISVTHYGIKNHLCAICGAAFGYRHGLISHQRKVHKRPKGIGRAKAVYQKLEEQGLLPPTP